MQYLKTFWEDEQGNRITIDIERQDGDAYVSQ